MGNGLGFTTAKMATEKMMEIQAQMQAQAAHNQDFLSQLDSWTKDVKRKDHTLKATTAIKKKQLPPVRSLVHASQDAAPTPSDTATPAPATSPSKRIASSDYRSWDNFDVEGELSRLDHEEKTAQHSKTARQTQVTSAALREDEEDAPMSAMEAQQHMANIEKDNGNEQFKQGKFAAAVSCYTRGLELDPRNAVLLGNRSMAYIKLKQYDDARLDASAAVTIDPNYLKAFSRRATANTQLKRFQEAIDDWNRVLQLDKSNKVARKEIPVLRKLKLDYDVLRHAAFNPLIAAQSVAKERAPQRQFVRIPIEEVGESLVAEVTSPSVAVSLASTEPSMAEAQVDAPIPTTKPKVGPTTKQMGSAANESPKAVAVGAGGRLPDTAPVSNVEFELAWNQTHQDRQLQAQLLKMLDANQLPILLGNGLDQPLLAAIVGALHTVFVPNKWPLFPLLRKLTRVDRFDIALMLLDASTLLQLHALVRHVLAGTFEPAPSDKLQRALASKYQLDQ